MYSMNNAICTLNCFAICFPILAISSIKKFNFAFIPVSHLATQRGCLSLPFLRLAGGRLNDVMLCVGDATHTLLVVRFFLMLASYKNIQVFGFVLVLMVAVHAVCTSDDDDDDDGVLCM